MDVLNDIFGGLFRGLLALFGWLGDGGSLVMISILLGLLMLWAFKLFGDIAALERAKNKMQAYMMEMRLFDREFAVVGRAMARMFGWNARLFVLTLKPALIATAPMLLLFAQMEHYYGMRPLRTGESTIVSAQFSQPFDDASELPEVSLSTTSDVVEVETLPVRSRSTGLVSWRIRGMQPGVATLELSTPEFSATKSVHVGDELDVVSKRRSTETGDLLLHPTEDRLNAGPLRWIEVRYPQHAVSILGWATHWMIWLVIVSLIAAFVGRSAINRIRPGTI